MSKKNNTKIRRGSSNIFADLGYLDPGTHLLKAQLVSCISEIINQQSLTQSEVAKIIRLSQPDVSRLLKGQFREISVERIIRILLRLGCKLDIAIKLPGNKLADSVIHLQQLHLKAM